MCSNWMLSISRYFYFWMSWMLCLGMHFCSMINTNECLIWISVCFEIISYYMFQPHVDYLSWKFSFVWFNYEEKESIFAIVHRTLCRTVSFSCSFSFSFCVLAFYILNILFSGRNTTRFFRWSRTWITETAVAKCFDIKICANHSK